MKDKCCFLGNAARNDLGTGKHTTCCVQREISHLLVYYLVFTHFNVP